MTGWVLVAIMEVVFLYVVLAPRKWKPWSRRADRNEAIRIEVWRSTHPFDESKDARTDRFIAACEGRLTCNTTDVAVMKIEHDHLIDWGLLDPDEPTPYSHYLWNQDLIKNFTPLERQIISAQLSVLAQDGET
jgi:hypothetical protein